MRKILPILLILFCIRTAAQPIITSFSPLSGPIGTYITITGIGFDPNPDNNIVFLGAVKANVTAASGTSLTINVPLGATHKPISVLNLTTGLIGFSSKPFNVTFSSYGQPMSSATFSNVLKIPFGPSSSTTGLFIDGGDIDGDGKVDAILAPYNSATVYKNEYTGTFGISAFSTKVALSSGNFLVVGDLDNTGSLDIIGFTTSAGMASITVRQNTSTTGNFAFGSTLSFPSGLSSVSTGVITDIDVDGKVDIVCFHNNSISILKNTSSSGNLSFGIPTIVTAITNIRNLAFGDIDGDNKPDLAFTAANSNDHNIYIHRNITSGSIGPNPFDAAVTFALYDQPPVGSTSPFSVIIEDLDNDSKAEIIVGYSQPKISIFKNAATVGTIGAGSLLDRVDIASAPSKILRVADIDGDGNTDIINGAPGGSIYIHRNDINGAITAANFPYVFFTLTNTPIVDLQLADLTLDSRPEIIITDYYGAWNIVQNTFGVLPVSLAYLNGIWDNATTSSYLNWQTFSESNTCCFIVERSLDAQTFELIGQVQAKGTVNDRTSYSFTDNKPFVTKKIFYRLKMVDKDGQFTYSPITSVSRNNNFTEFTIIRQPRNSTINIIASNTNLLNRTTVIINSFTGQKVAEARITNTNQQLNLAFLPKGLYTIIIYADGLRQVERITL